MSLRLGAYVLTGDPVWLRSSLGRYYDLLDELVVLVPEDGLGWTGKALPVEECLAAVADVDVRRIARRVPGLWRDLANPMAADTAQRQAGIDALSPRVDWILQIDNDEVLPDPQVLVGLLEETEGVVGVEWPMRVLFRRVAGRFLAIAAADGGPVFEYPGPVAVRAGVSLVDARRVSGPVNRVVVTGDIRSPQLRQPVAPGETRLEVITSAQAILHNSWAKSPAEIWRKTRSWGHASGVKGIAYFALTWLPAPIVWRWMRDFHPFADGLWPRLVPVDLPASLLADPDRPPTRTAWRSRARR